MNTKIRQHLVPAKHRKTLPGTNPKKWITVHETANPAPGATANAHARLQAGGNSRNASWHYQVDDVEIVQSYEDGARCLHAGDGAKGTGNRESIAIEICVNGGLKPAAIQNAITLIRHLMAKHNIPTQNVVQHNRWSGKNCPTNLRRNGWANLIAALSGEEDTGMHVITGGGGQSVPSKPKPAALPKVKTDGYWGKDTTRALQRVLGTVVDGEVWGQWSGWKSKNPGLTSGWKWSSKATGSMVIRALQKRLGVKADGLIGPATIKALQKRYGLVQDGELWAKSPTIIALQKRLNEGRI